MIVLDGSIHTFQGMDKLRVALHTAAGANSAEEMAKVVFNTLLPAARAEFHSAFEKLAQPQQATERAGLLEAQQHPGQTARSALARAVQNASQSRGGLLARPGPWHSHLAALLERAKDKPQGPQKQTGGRKPMTNRPELIKLIQAFLTKHRRVKGGWRAGGRVCGSRWGQGWWHLGG